MSENENVFDVSPGQPQSSGNPYASPSVAMGPPPVQNVPQADALVWSYGNKLILRRGTELPDICVQTDIPQPGIRKRRKISWAPPWVPLLIFAGLLPLIIVSLILTKRATIRYSVSESQHRRRKNAIMVGWIIGLVGLGTIVLAIYLGNQPARMPGADGAKWFFLGIFGFVLALVGLVYGTHMGLPFKPAKITSDYIMLRSLSPSFVARFPAWPYQPL